MTSSKLAIWCERVIEIGCLLSLLIAPLFFNVHSDRVFEPDKLTLIRSLALLITAAWLIKIFDQWDTTHYLDKIRPSSKNSIWHLPFVLPLFSLVLIYLISTVFSVTPRVSWAGSYQRLQGTYSTLSYIIIFALSAHTIRRRPQIERLVTTAIVISLPIALYGMLQRFDLDPLPWGGDVQNRIAGHMGNAIFIAAYLIMVVPLTMARIITSFANILLDEKLNPADVARSSVYIFALAVQLIAIWWSGSRGPQLGLGVGLFAFVLIFLVALRNTSSSEESYGSRALLRASYPILLVAAGFVAALVTRNAVSPTTSFLIFFTGFGAAVLTIVVLLGLRRGWPWLWLSWIQIAVLAGIWLVAFNLAGSSADGQTVGPAAQLFDSWRDAPGIGRLGRMLDADTETGRVRVLIWQGSLKMVTSPQPIQFPDGSTDSFSWLRPLIGYGPEAMYVAYNRYYPPELGTLEARNASPDRSHNETWDALVITGVIGFLVWQWLYLSIFLFSFRWLGVIRGRRDQWLLIALWIGLGVATAIGFSLWRGPEYIGVTLPLGSILGLVTYLIYYAVASPTAASTDEPADPFSPLRMVMIALLGGIIAHYVEIHFGIAIAASRVYFFVYAALILIIGYLMPLQKAAQAQSNNAKPQLNKGKGRKRTAARSSAPSYLASTYLAMLIIGVMIATLGYSFTIFTPRPDQVFQSLADLPTTGEIFYQSLFINPKLDFALSPFVYLLIVMSWLLAVFAFVSEMVKRGTIPLPKEGGKIPRKSTAAIIFFVGGGLALVAAGYGFVNASTGLLTPLARIGYLTLSPLLAFAALYAGLALWGNTPQALLRGVVVAGSGVLLGVALLIIGGAGTWLGLIIGGCSTVLLVLLWDNSAAPLVSAGGITGLGSFFIGMAFTWLQAGRIRQNFITPESVTPETPEVIRRVAEADQFVQILTQYYVFIFALILIFAVLFGLHRFNKVEKWASIGGFAAAILIIPLAFWLIQMTNLKVVQSDMVYKRGKPFDAQAGQLTVNNENPELALRFWDNTIGLYDRALELAPAEDFYYLWLGRAYLEKSGLLVDQERDILLTTAERSLQQAQKINPLNTDHTANLARLNTRWAAVTPIDDPAREERIGAAEAYYLAAIDLSPQNSIIRNEYARMVYSFTQDCDQAADLYQASIAADPYFEQTRFEQAELAAICASTAPEEERTAYYDTMLNAMAEGSRLAGRQSGIARRWLQIAQTLQQLGAFDYAIRAYEAAMPFADDQEPLWRIQYFAATAHEAAGQDQLAADLAEASLAAAPPEAQSDIQAFIDGLSQ